jgi:hypothetical protein
MPYICAQLSFSFYGCNPSIERLSKEAKPAGANNTIYTVWHHPDKPHSEASDKRRLVQMRGGWRVVVYNTAGVSGL